MLTPGQMATDEWIYLSTYAELTTSIAPLLLRATGDPEIVIDSINITEVAGGTPTFTLRQTSNPAAALSSDATGNLATANALTAGQLKELPTVAKSDRGWIYLQEDTGIYGLASANDVVNVRINYRKRR